MISQAVTNPGAADPIIDLIEKSCGIGAIDDFASHMISLSDVVKNEMRKKLNWDDNTVHSKLRAIIESGLDKNGRYSERPLEQAVERHRTFSQSYIDTQCLLTEWLNIYRSLRAYFHILKKPPTARAPSETP
ncbi:MAG: hypothetical protein ACI9MJ_000045 [Alphaproteobacteria bacterium]|jgi:hypothetical protein